MSAKSGDTARFHRLRKARCNRRVVIREIRAAMVAKAKSAAEAEAAAPKA